MQTPRTVLTWATLDEWLACARKIDRRRASRLRNRQAELHARALPVSFVDQCASRAALVSCDRLLRRGPTHFCQPPRGQRQNATHTALIVAIANRIAHIDHADDHASMTLGHNSRNAGSVIPQGAAPSPIPSAGPGGGHSEEEGRKGFVTGFSGRETSRARPSQESPAMTRKSAARRDSARRRQPTRAAARARYQQGAQYCAGPVGSLADEGPQDAVHAGRGCRARSQHPRQGHPAEPDRPSRAGRPQRHLRGRCWRPPAQSAAETDAGISAAARAEPSSQAARPKDTRWMLRMRRKGTGRGFDQVAATGHLSRCSPSGQLDKTG